MKQGFILRDFLPQDLKKAEEIALKLWGDEGDFIPPFHLEKVYGFLVRYYYFPESSFNCAVTDENGDLCGFLLAHTRSAAENTDSPENDALEHIQTYKAYLDGNKKAEEYFLRKDEVILLLFASIQKGCGSLLMKEFERRCRTTGIRSILLWTDDTCNLEWYQKNGFSELCRFPAVPSLPGRLLYTFIFRKELD